MSTITAEEFSRILSEALTQAQPTGVATSADVQQTTEAVQQTTEAVQAVQQELNNVADIMNPYRGMTREQLVDEFARMGMQTYAGLTNATREELNRRLNFVKLIEEQAEVMTAYQQRAPNYIPQSAQRLSLDTFVQYGARTPRGIPTDARFTFLPRSIPPAVVKLNRTTGVYELTQGGVTDYAKQWADANRWALSGGAYSDEMRELRKIRIDIERGKKQRFVGKAYKV